MKLLSRSSLSTSVATRGIVSSEFTAEGFRLTAYVGFGKKPTGMNPHVRFIAVKARHLDELYKPGGVYIEGDPLAQGPSGPGRKAETYLTMFSSEDTLETNKVCYKSISGIHRLILDMNLLGGKGFEPAAKLAQVMSSPIGKTALASLTRDPVRGFQNTLDLVHDYIYTDPIEIGLHSTPSGGVRVFLKGKAMGSGCPETKTLLILKSHPILQGGDLSNAMALDHPSYYDLGTRFDIGSGYTAEQSVVPSVAGNHGILELVPARVFPVADAIRDYECGIHIRYNLENFDGLILDVKHVVDVVQSLMSLDGFFPIGED